MFVSCVRSSGDEATSWATVATGVEIVDRWRTTQQRNEREALMASRAAARSDARRHNRPPSRCSVAQSTVLIQLLFPSSTTRRTKQCSQSKRTTTNKRNNERQSKLCSTFCCDISRDGYSMWENQQTKRNMMRTSRCSLSLALYRSPSVGIDRLLCAFVDSSSRFIVRFYFN
jgi:hypothetical protein